MSFTLDVKDTDLTTQIAEYCKESLSDTEWNLLTYTMFPAWYRFRFQDEQTHLLISLKFLK